MDNIYRMFYIISKHGNEYIDDKLKQFNVSSYHYSFIKKIYENPGITRDHIKNLVHMHPSNTTRAIDYLEENGLITKKVDENDRRICELYPTSKLEIVYLTILKCEKEWIEIITAGLTEEEKANYFSFIKKSCDLSINEIHRK